MELEQLSEGPMDLGTKIRRRNRRFGAPIDGEMVVVEWEPERALGIEIRDANMEMRGRVTFEGDASDRTTLMITTELPELDEPTSSLIRNRMQRTITNVKTMIESEG